MLQQEFKEILTELTTSYTAIVTLRNKLSQYAKGTTLLFNDGKGNDLEFSRKDLRTADSNFTRAVAKLSKYHAAAGKRKARKTVDPSTLSATYTPVYAGEALQFFFTQGLAGFGFVDPQAASTSGPAAGGGSLMERLPRARQGYLLRNTTTMLFYIYAHQQQLQDEANAQYSHADDVMNAAFGGQIPSTYYVYTVGTGAEAKSVKEPMAVALQRGLINVPMNTYQVIQQSYPPQTGENGEQLGFDPNHFKTYFYQNLAAANYSSKDNLPEGSAERTALLDTQIRREMLDEHNLVKATSQSWKELLKPGRALQREARKKQKDAEKRRQAQLAQYAPQ